MRPGSFCVLMSILFVRIAKGCLYLGVGAPRGIRYASVGRQTVEVETRNGPWRKSGTFFSAKGFGKRVGFVRRLSGMVLGLARRKEEASVMNEAVSRKGKSRPRSFSSLPGDDQVHIMVVESPAKAKTISNYLGDTYEVIPSFGHIRDLPAKSGSVTVAEGPDVNMTWTLSNRGRKFINELKDIIKGTSSTHLYLATDPDREGEAIAWHIHDVLRQEKAIDE
ncbi:hypothetical protein AAMO2058_001278800, partial [Amorphochlora amoebiformis]